MRISDWSSDVCSSDLEVPKIGSTTAIGVEESRQGLRLLMHGGVVSMGFAVLTQLQLAAAEAARWFRIGAGASGIAGGLPFALLGVGHLVDWKSVVSGKSVSVRVTPGGRRTPKQ